MTERTPLLEQEGWLRHQERHQENDAKPPLKAQAGWSFMTEIDGLTNLSAPVAVASRHFLDGAATPPLQALQGGDYGFSLLYLCYS
jgi:hypothetical protein